MEKSYEHISTKTINIWKEVSYSNPIEKNVILLIFC